MGLEMVADRLRPFLNDTRNQSLFIGSGHPDLGNTHSKISMEAAVRNSQKDGSYSSTLAKSLLVFIYTEWDEVFRRDIAAEMGVKVGQVSCDLMGDLRHVRHWIIHNKSRIDGNVSKIKVIEWGLLEGRELSVSSEKFANLIDLINRMNVVIRKAHA